jgi:Uncharacterised nucleotidyltransferase
MSVSILPMHQVPLPGAGTEDQVLLRAVRACILRRTDRSLYGVPAGAVDWQELRDTAVRNKLAVLLLRGLNQSDEAPQHLLAALEEQQDATVRLNTRNLLTLRHLVPIFASRGVNAVVFKGPCAQKLVYGDFFAKPSSDVDLLILPRDFATAGQVVTDNGFAVAEACSSAWWTVFLGEQHFLSSDRTRSAIDLHHRTQQPGCPAPRKPELLVSQSTTVAVGSSNIPTLSHTNTTLLSCMSLAKALIHREPAGGYVCDIAAGMAGHSQDELAQLIEDADRQGLRNTLALGLRAACLLFGVHTRIGEEGSDVFRAVADAELLRMILRPWATEIHWPRRSRMLRDFCDHEMAYVREICWKVAGEVCRKLCDGQR